MSQGASLAEVAAGRDLFLFRAVRAGVDSGVLSSDMHDDLLLDLSRIASDDMDALVLREPHTSAREIAIAGALHRASVGLEFAADGIAARGADLLGQAPLSTAANTGAAILARLREQAEETRQRLTMHGDAEGARGELYVANTLEDVFLRELTRGMLTVSHASPRLTEATPARRVASLDDVRTASAMLSVLDARAALFASFPRGRLFAQVYPPDRLGGCDAVVICRMFVLAVTATDPQPRFDCTETAIADFRQAAPAADVLNSWIDDHVARGAPIAQQTHAREYLQACLEALPGLLDLLV